MKINYIILVIIATAFVPRFSSADVHALRKEFAKLEASSGGRIGVFAFDTLNGLTIDYRAGERFPMGCTSKVIGVAAILKKSMADNSLLQKRISFTKSDLINWTPITQTKIESGMTVRELCAAAISYSDNTAMNLLVKELGGLNKMNDFARSINDYAFRQDNGWPQEALSGGPNNFEDSTTPAEMASSLQKIVLGDVLAPKDRDLLATWLIENTTGNERIRAGAPKDWIVGDKTGSGYFYGTTNDIAIIWPPNSPPIILAIYFTSNEKNEKRRNDVVASAARLILNEIRKINVTVGTCPDIGTL